MSDFGFELADPSKAPADFPQLRLAAMIGQRDEKAALRELKKRCRNLAFAEQAHYAVREVETEEATDELRPSVVFMRAAAECLGSVSSGGQILSKHIETISVRGWAYDARRDRKQSVDDLVDCVLRRRGKGKDVRLEGSHLRARIYAIMGCAERRALQNVLPATFVEKGFAAVLATLEREERRLCAADPLGSLSRLLADLETCDVSRDEVARKFGRELEALDPHQRIELRAALKSIRAGESTPLDHFAPPPFTAADLETKREPAPVATPPKSEPKTPPNTSGKNWRDA